MSSMTGEFQSFVSPTGSRRFRSLRTSCASTLVLPAIVLSTIFGGSVAWCEGFGGGVAGIAVNAAATSVVPGAVLSRSNGEVAREALPPELLEKVRSGELEIRVVATTELPRTSAYLEATERHAGQVELRDDGSLTGYVAGLPFPYLDLADPRCGLKAAWNLRHHDFGRATEAWGMLRQVGASGRVTRMMEFYYVRAYGMHLSPGDKNRWEKEGILYKEFYQALAPLDLRNLMNLRYRYDDDRRSDDTWAYAPGERRVRKMPASHEESTLGTDLLREDYSGFSGYLHAHEWKCLGTTRVLAPIGVPAAQATLDARGYPADPWQPRAALVVEAVPRTKGHPYARRVLYVDQELFVLPYVLIYEGDPAAHAKTLFTVYGDPRHNPGNESVTVPVWLAEVMVNHRNGSATITTLSRASFDAAIPEERFTVDQMISLGK